MEIWNSIATVFMDISTDCLRNRVFQQWQSFRWREILGLRVTNKFNKENKRHHTNDKFFKEYSNRPVLIRAIALYNTSITGRNKTSHSNVCHSVITWHVFRTLISELPSILHRVDTHTHTHTHIHTHTHTHTHTYIYPYISVYCLSDCKCNVNVYAFTWVF
jgi:hypothetical protein